MRDAASSPTSGCSNRHRATASNDGINLQLLPAANSRQLTAVGALQPLGDNATLATDSGCAKDLLQLFEEMLPKIFDETGTRLLMLVLHIKARKSPSRSIGGNVRTLIRKVILGTASVIALGIAGEIASSALDYAADANTATAANMPAPAQNPNDALTADPLRRDDIRWAQLELRNRGLYLGSLDGILGPGTRRAAAISLGSGTPGDAQSSTTSDLSR